jgi:aminoglycoside phosphotransferase (APT) family kinase protein
MPRGPVVGAVVAQAVNRAVRSALLMISDEASRGPAIVDDFAQPRRDHPLRVQGLRTDGPGTSLAPSRGMNVPPGLAARVEALLPGRRVTAFEPLAPDTGATAGATAKAAGYGQPLRVRLDDGSAVVWRTAGANDFGHDRRADRAQELLQAFDDFRRVPQHVQALDLGAITPDGELVSLHGAGEPYLITSWAEGSIYAGDLRRVAAEGVARELDLHRVDALASYLAELHGEPGTGSYRRAIRDLVGHGEGIFGIVDAFPDDVPAAPPARLRAIEARCADWRWRMRGRDRRLARTHGDFHPFNVVFGDGAAFTLLDASRGAEGDPADDVTAMAINYVFFALDHPRSWAHGLGALWRRFWRTYAQGRDDAGLAEAAPPFFAWRALVLACPRFYPALSVRGRDALLGLAERVLEAGRLEPAAGEELFP